MDFMTAVKTCFSKYATFSGRAQRSEFWWWVLFGFVTNLILGLIPFVGLIWSLALLIPNLAVTARRLHDTDRSGWWMLAPYGFALLAFFVTMGGAMMGGGMGPDGPMVGGGGFFGAILGFVTAVMFIVLLVWLIMRGTDGPNRFGADPLAGAADEDPAAKFMD